MHFSGIMPTLRVDRQQRNKIMADTKNDYELGMDFLYEEEFAQAYRHLMKAYEDGDMAACNPLGDLYYMGEVPGEDEPDLDKALEFYELGMNEGYVMCVLKWCNAHIENGIDEERIVPLLEILADDDEDPEAEAAFLLFCYYKEIAENEEKAAFWYDRAVEMGSELITQQ